MSDYDNGYKQGSEDTAKELFAKFDDFINQEVRKMDEECFCLSEKISALKTEYDTVSQSKIRLSVHFKQYKEKAFGESETLPTARKESQL